jgi:hypothetical protein
MSVSRFLPSLFQRDQSAVLLKKIENRSGPFSNIRSYLPCPSSAAALTYRTRVLVATVQNPKASQQNRENARKAYLSALAIEAVACGGIKGASIEALAKLHISAYCPQATKDRLLQLVSPGPSALTRASYVAVPLLLVLGAYYLSRDAQSADHVADSSAIANNFAEPNVTLSPFTDFAPDAADDDVTPFSLNSSAFTAVKAAIDTPLMPPISTNDSTHGVADIITRESGAFFLGVAGLAVAIGIGKRCIFEIMSRQANQMDDSILKDCRERESRLKTWRGALKDHYPSGLGMAQYVGYYGWFGWGIETVYGVMENCRMKSDSLLRCFPNGKICEMTNGQYSTWPENWKTPEGEKKCKDWVAALEQAFLINNRVDVESEPDPGAIVGNGGTAKS